MKSTHTCGWCWLCSGSDLITGRSRAGCGSRAFERPSRAAAGRLAHTMRSSGATQGHRRALPHKLWGSHGALDPQGGQNHSFPWGEAVRSSSLLVICATGPCKAERQPPSRPSHTHHLSDALCTNTHHPNQTTHSRRPPVDHTMLSSAKTQMALKGCVTASRPAAGLQLLAARPRSLVVRRFKVRPVEGARDSGSPMRDGSARALRCPLS
jgi:hypothetical protein